MMEIVVKIPDDMIKSLEQGNFGAKYNIYDLVGCLMNGTPLPKGHGDLIDRSEISIPYDICDGDEAMDYVNEVSAIVEADKENTDEEE